MNTRILLGRGRQITGLPQEQWKQHLAQAPEHGEARRGFMTEAHQMVRYFVVRELPYIGRPIEPALISEELKLSLTQVDTILRTAVREIGRALRASEGVIKLGSGNDSGSHGNNEGVLDDDSADA